MFVTKSCKNCMSLLENSKTLKVTKLADVFVLKQLTRELTK